MEIKYNADTLLVIGDQHFGIKRNNLTWLNTQISYFENFIKPLVKRLISEGKKVIIVLLGDLFHHRQILHLKILSDVQDMLNELGELCEIHMILGNHDVYYVNSNDVNSPQLLDLENVKIFQTPTEIKYGDTKATMLPWVANKTIFNEKVEAAKGELIFTHCDINDFRLNKAKLIDFGVDSNSFKKFEYVFNGHIHLQQVKDNILNVGSIIHMDRNDVGNKKGVYVYDLKTKTPTFIENNYSPIYTFIYLEQLSKEDLHDDDFIISLVKNNYVDVYISTNAKTLLTHSRLQEIMVLIGLHSKESKRYDVDDELDEDWEKIEIHDTFGSSKNILLDFFSTYINNQEIKQINKTRLKNDINSIINGIDIGEDVVK